MIVSLIAAMSENRAIGLKGLIPWHISQDLKRFRAITSGHPVVMGRKTFESIGRPLPKRRNLVISRQEGLGKQPAYAGVEVYSSLQGALTALAGASPSSDGQGEEVFILGGGEIYAIALPICHRVYETRVHREVEGDAFFPELPKGGFRELRREAGEEGEWTFTFIDWERI